MCAMVCLMTEPVPKLDCKDKVTKSINLSMNSANYFVQTFVFCGVVV